MEQFHVIAFIPEEQLALRLLMFNYIKHRVKVTVTAAAKLATDSSISNGSEKVCQIVEDYVDLSDVLASVQTVETAKPRMFYFSKSCLDFLQHSANHYDPGRHALPDGQEVLIDHYIEHLKYSLGESSKYTYTKDEVFKAIKAG